MIWVWFWNPTVEREPIPESYPLTSKCMSWHMCLHSYIHIAHNNNVNLDNEVSDVTWQVSEPQGICFSLWKTRFSHKVWVLLSSVHSCSTQWEPSMWYAHRPALNAQWSSESQVSALTELQPSQRSVHFLGLCSLVKKFKSLSYDGTLQIYSKSERNHLSSSNSFNSSGSVANLVSLIFYSLYSHSFKCFWQHRQCATSLTEAF